MMFLPAVISLEHIKVNGMSGGATFNTGSSMILRRTAVNKRNEGYGEQSGDCVVTVLPILSINDYDQLDSTAKKTSLR
ncbi:hypothetical protein AXI59_17270 [Bacillus nakamurai]|uniref:Uncharacterized protein n=1 Tax=Bacillus nakamurai TaxID=1793963 RepID=A0A150F9F6_9BACI|nr:hypothetical protein [Bacillus nakamurai]KXZ18175.1 hypothetical protein AXI59_17270 [Bacillus nakamurai]KXZ21737.1 hypothetical protein AXI58_12345 [Bacillus nakamurai]MCC9021605.1 hypothetical protein [Bacillus nakamurai]MCP6683950.1 hypothetical protein [Bacillus nakamurai]MED1226612.1 hypothetical protein [Bacillus nakamurai]